MRTAAKRYPRKKDVAVVLRGIKLCIPMDKEPSLEWRTSQSGAPNLRINGQTDHKQWKVDIYVGSYYVVQADFSSDVQSSIPAVVSYLLRKLNVKQRNNIA